MASKLATNNYNYFSTLLARMAEGHVSSGVALRADLKADVDAANAAFNGHVNLYVGLRAQEKEMRVAASQHQDDGVEALRKAKYALKSQLNKNEVDSVLQVYQLHLRIPRARLDILGRLRMVNEAVAQQTEDNRKPPQHLQTDLTAAHDGLSEKIEKINSIRADIEEAKCGKPLSCVSAFMPIWLVSCPKAPTIRS